MTLMGHFPKGICPVMSNEAYPDQPRDQRSVSHSSILLFPSGQVGEKLYVLHASLLRHACLSHFNQLWNAKFGRRDPHRK